MKLFVKYKYGIALILILFFAITMRITRYCLDSRVEKDAVLYINMARDWNSKGIEHAFDRNPRIPPLYIYLLMLGEKTGIGAENAGVAISILAGSLLVIAVFFISASFMDKNLALISAFLAAIHPGFVRLSPEVMRDGLFIFCFASSIACYVQGINRKWILLWVGGGLFAAMATLTRSEGIELIVIPFAWAAYETCLYSINKKKNQDKNEMDSSETTQHNFKFKSVICRLLAAVITFSIFSFPVQVALEKTSSTWAILDSRLMNYIKTILN